MTTSGTRERTGARWVGQCRTSTPSRRAFARQRRQVPAEVAHRHERARRAAERVAANVHVLGLERGQQRADVPRGARPRERERRDVHSDPQRCHAGESRYPASTASPHARQVKREACSTPVPRGSVERLLERIGEVLRVVRIGAQGDVAARLVQRRMRRDHRGNAARQRLDDRDPEALEARRVGEGRRAAVEPRELVVGDEAEQAHALGGQRLAAPSPRARRARASAPDGARAGARRRPRAPAGSCAARASRPRARTARRGRPPRPPARSAGRSRDRRRAPAPPGRRAARPPPTR